MTSNTGVGSAGPSSVTAQYETLRRAALGQALSPEARYGLMLFLRRGMWGWARAVAMASTSVSQPSCSPSLNWTASDEYKAVIHVFAAMAMNAENRGVAP
jgi:hypothetical protein